jgi:hypothetical protein
MSCYANSVGIQSARQSVLQIRQLIDNKLNVFTAIHPTVVVCGQRLQNRQHFLHGYLFLLAFEINRIGVLGLDADIAVLRPMLN